MVLQVVRGETSAQEAARKHGLTVAEVFGPVLDEDQDIMPRVQRGLRATRKPSVSLGVYQESRIRLFRRTLERNVPR